MNIIDRLLGMLMAEECVQCGDEGSALCRACLADYRNSAVGACFLCNAHSSDFVSCKACRKKTPISQLFIAAEYESAIKKLLNMYKFGQSRYCAPVIAELMADSLPSFERDSIIFVPVPTATSRVRMRGFDHAVLLGDELARITGQRLVRALRRTSQARQVGAGRNVRIEQMDSEFRVSRQKAFKGRAVCLVDDVSTTGATMDAAARAVKKAGAKSVIGVVLAKG